MKNMANNYKSRFNPDLPAFLYVLEDPRVPGEIRYIGLTQSLPQRLTTHLQLAKRKNPAPLYQWIAGLLAEGLEPRIRPLWQGCFADAERNEVLAIARYRELGFPLLNQADGGPGTSGWHPSEAQRKAMSEFQRGRKKPDGHGEAVSRASKGRPKSEAHRLAMSLAKKGKPWSEKRREQFLKKKLVCV